MNAATDSTGANVSGPVSAGSLVSIYGSQLAAGIALAQSVPHSTQLGQTSVTFNGIPAALDFVAGTQINAQIPWNALPAGVSGTVNVVVTRNGVNSAPEPVVINQFGPAVYSTSGHALAFIVSDPNDSARFYAYAAPNTAGLRTSPAKVDDILLVYATGMGAIASSIPNGSSPDAILTNTKATVLFNGIVPGTVLYSGIAPGFPGVYQINVRVPAGLPASNAMKLQIQMGGVTSPANGGTIATQ